MPLRAEPLWLLDEKGGVDPRRLVAGLNFSYGAHWEPQSGPDWRKHAWRNRPCCSLHFEVIQIPQRERFFGSTRATIGTRSGELVPANGRGEFFGNHVRFLFRENEINYVASLHAYGPGSVDLLRRLVRSLVPASELR